MRRILTVALVLALFTPRCMPKPVYAYSGTISIWAQKDNDWAARNFAGTTAGLQAAEDYLAGGKGQVQLGPGTLETSTAIWIHSYSRTLGSGRGVTIIRRAAGSITDGDAANSGCVFGTSAYGANGTLSSSSSIQYDITVSDLTLDGRAYAFSSLASTSPHQAGLLAQSVDTLRVSRVKVRNTLRSGFMTMECRSVKFHDVETLDTGQFSGATTKNAFDLYNYNNTTSGFGVEYELSDFVARNSTLGTSQVVVSCTNVQRVRIANGIATNFNEILEIQGNTAAASQANRYITMENVIATGFNQEALLFSTIAAGEIGDVKVAHCQFEAASSHTNRIINIGAGLNVSCYNIEIAGCVFKNVNQADASAKNWIDMDSNTSATYKDISIHDCQFYGNSASTRTNDTGIRIGSTNAYNVSLRDVLFKDVPGRGIVIADVNNAAMNQIVLERVTVDGSNSYGYQVTMDDAGTQTIKDLRMIDCIAKDSAKQTGDAGLEAITAAGSTLSQMQILGFRAFKTAGATMLYGIDLHETAGTIDDVSIVDCDLGRVQTASFRPVTGTPTNIHFTPRHGRGTDITAAATIAIPTDGDVFHVTGNTNITNGITVNPWDNGRVVTLIFEGTPTLSDTGTNKLAGNFVAAGTTNDFDSLVIRCDGTNWTECARSAN